MLQILTVARLLVFCIYQNFISFLWPTQWSIYFLATGGKIGNRGYEKFASYLIILCYFHSLCFPPSCSIWMHKMAAARKSANPSSAVIPREIVKLFSCSSLSSSFYASQTQFPTEPDKTSCLSFSLSQYHADLCP